MKIAPTIIAGVLILSLGAGCDIESIEVATALFEVATGPTQDLYALPFPNDLRLRSDGTIDLARLGVWKKKDLIQLYLAQVAKGGGMGGFALNAAAYFRFNTALELLTLPKDSQASMQDNSSVIWVNIDPASPGYGQRVPVRVKFTRDRRCANGDPSMEYIGDNHLAVLPVYGFPLAPSTRYAVLLTEALADENGDPIMPDADFSPLLLDQAPSQPSLLAAHVIYAPLRAYLKKQGLTGIISAAVFTTGAPAAISQRAREVVYLSAAPTAADLVVARDAGEYFELNGTYKAPNFQAGTPPYASPTEGGEILLDNKGYPKVARIETLRFALSIPRAVMPAAGWPLVIYAHGTGGSYRTFMENDVAKKLANVKDSKGQTIANMAVVGIDQNIHGTRVPPYTSPDIWFFNFQNPAAAVHNVVQAGIDDYALLRMVKGLTAKSVPWGKGSGKSGSLTWDPGIKFDPTKIYFMGHSQGGLTGPVFLAFEPEVKGAVLSGAGAGAVLSLLGKTKPISIPAMVEAAIGDKPIDEFHPVLNLIQQMLEPAETANYGRMLIRYPAQNVGPKHIYLSQGFVDHYTPIDTTDALAAAIGLPLVAPVQRKIAALELSGIQSTVTPVMANLLAGSTKVTGGVLQYKSSPSTPAKVCSSDTDCKAGDYCAEGGACHDDGHFVIYNDARAVRQYTQFLATMARDGVPTIVD